MGERGDDAGMRPVLVAGAINTDLVARVEHAPAAGETVTGSSFAIFGGGKGANQAIATARSGAPTAMLGALGDDDFGRARRADLNAEGIMTTFVAQSEAEPSGVALIVVEDKTGQNRISYVPGATLTISPAQALEAIEQVQPGVVLTTLEPVPETVDALIEEGHAIGALVVLNASPEAEGARSFLDRLDVLVLNEVEAEQLLGSPVTAENSARAALALAELGPATVVITLGAAGAVVALHGETSAIPAPVVTVVDTTGAGDAFTGAFAAELARGSDAVAAARTGVVAGSLATTVPGAYPGLPRREAIEAMLQGRS
jgi:ribokinase